MARETLTSDEKLPRTGAYAPSATCKHGTHPFDCREGCCPPENRTHAELVADYDRLVWLLRNGEKYFGTLWREATYRDIEAVQRALGMTIP